MRFYARWSATFIEPKTPEVWAQRSHHPASASPLDVLELEDRDLLQQ